MPGWERMPGAWSRRSLLAATGAACVAALAGCRVRLEDDAPHVPLLPVRTPMPDEQALQSAWVAGRQLHQAALAAGGPPRSVPARLALLHATQVDVLAQVLRDGGAPLTGPSPTSPTSPPSTARTGPTGSPTSSAPTTSPAPSAAAAPVVVSRKGATAAVASLVDAEGAAISDAGLAALVAVSTPHRPLLAAMAAQRAAAVTLLGGTIRWGSLTVPLGAAAVPVLEATRAAAYGFDVVVGQADAPGRRTARADLADLRARISVLEDLAGPTAPPPALGYALPFPVGTPSAARALARHLLTSLRTALGAQLAADGVDLAALRTLLAWLSRTEVQASRWGAPLVPFPGLTTA